MRASRGSHQPPMAYPYAHVRPAYMAQAHMMPMYGDYSGGYAQPYSQIPRQLVHQDATNAYYQTQGIPMMGQGPIMASAPQAVDTPVSKPRKSAIIIADPTTNEVVDINALAKSNIKESKPTVEIIEKPRMPVQIEIPPALVPSSLASEPVSETKQPQQIHSDEKTEKEKLPPSEDKLPTSPPSKNDILKDCEPVSPTPLPEEGSISDACKSKKNKKKTSKSELNRKGDEKALGSDMDLFCHNPKENAEKSSGTPDILEEPKVEEQSSINLNTPSPPVVENKVIEPTPEVVQETTVSENSVPIKEPLVVSKEPSSPLPEKPIIETPDTTVPPPAIDAVKDKEPASVNGDEAPPPSKPAPKYEYKEDQWSPDNPTGKKQYDREFLLQLRDDPLSTVKPPNLPAMDIIKLSGNVNSSRVDMSNRIDFMPNFAKPSGRGSIAKRPSKDGRGGNKGGSMQGNKKHIVISGLNIQEKVKLNTSENAWKATMFKDSKESESNSLEELSRKVRSILNKLTPQMFDQLLEQFNNLIIDSKEKLSLCIDLVFKKAIEEPGFSKAYAKMCQTLQKKNVDSVKFKSLLITRVQKEFTTASSSNIVEQYKKDMASAVTDEEKKTIQELFDFEERKSRKRKTANAKFIGEIYVLDMLTLRIVHECISTLLGNIDEESLESFCQLISTVGKKVNSETNQVLREGPNKNMIRPMNYYFNRVQNIIDKENISSRIKFLLLDALDLHGNNYIPRNNAFKDPTTIDEIKKTAESKRREQQLFSMTSHPGNNKRGGGGGGSRNSYSGTGGGGHLNSYDKKSSSFRGPNMDEEIKNIRVFTASRNNASKNSTGLTRLGPSMNKMGQDSRFGSGHKPDMEYRNFFKSSGGSFNNSEEKKLPVRGSFLGKMMSESDIRDKLKVFLNGIADASTDDAVSHVTESYHESNLPLVFYYFFEIAIDKKPELREFIGELFVILVNNQLVTSNVIQTAGQKFAVTCFKDLIIDVPKFWTYYFEFFVPGIKTGVFTLVTFFLFADHLNYENEDPNLAARAIGGMFSALVERGMKKDKIIQLYEASERNLSDILPENELAFCINKHNLDYIYLVSVRKQLKKKLADFEDGAIRKWIDETLKVYHPDNIWLVKILVDECVECAIKKTNSDEYDIEDDILKKHIPIMKYHLNNEREKEHQALNVLVSIAHRLSFPRNLISGLFQYFFEATLVSAETFLEWKNSKDIQDSKGVAIKSSTQFFASIPDS